MRPSSHSPDIVKQATAVFAPKIYYFNPLLAGSRSEWPRHIQRCRDLGFDIVLMAPPFAPGAAGDIFLTADHERVNPAIDGAIAADHLLSEFSQACSEYGLRLFIDVLLGRFALDGAIVSSAPQWFHPCGSPGLRIDPRLVRRHTNSAYGRFDDPTIANELIAWWIDRLQRLTHVGVTGFRFEEPHLVPASNWRTLIGAIKTRQPDCRFLAWTPGTEWSSVAALTDVGFDAAFSSVAWWDGRASWLVEEFELLRGVGTVIGTPEPLYGRRLTSPIKPSDDVRTRCRHLLRRTAAVSDGIMIPMGLEFGSTVDMDRRGGGPGDLFAGKDSSHVSLADEIRDANALTTKLAALSLGGQMRMLTDPGGAVTGLLRSDAPDVRGSRSAMLVVVNTDLGRERSLPITLDPLPPAAGLAAKAGNLIAGERAPDAVLAAGEIRLVGVQPSTGIELPRAERSAATAGKLSRIVIDNVTPSVDDGRFAAKRIIGEKIEVEADVFADGHKMLAVELQWREADANDWHRTPMSSQGNDRWRAAFLPDRIGRYEFTIEAWWDQYSTFCRDLEVKHKAEVGIEVEIAEGRRLLEQAKQRSQNGAGTIIASALDWLADAEQPSIEVFTLPDVREVMQDAQDRLFLCRTAHPFLIDVERPQAAFAAWYELFPRSATDAPGRHGTFNDVIRRLPAIKALGFDVLYLPPIHPIGVTNRKGKNNSVTAEPGDVGSPYAIGSTEGGHDAIHPALGTIEEFRRLRDAALANGMEIALDFAIQCSPDHPWLKEHPEWFNWRPDGSVRYAENPPKKYQDIVNVDFYTPEAFPALWIALRDVVFFWIREGVRVFRVDNPHTKPLPFWEWLILQVRGRYPDVIFLSEAFTRPKMMYRLAKAGFSQSYSYFTWRNTKQELTDYFIELTTTHAKEYFRPNLFVNTPDINPYFLQTSGRPGFLIRAALAATLSGLWGVYSGFEVCEAAALPGREEYLDSEKYQIRVRRYDAPGNISAEIAKLNRIRRSHIALQSHLGVSFYRAHDDRVMLYGKMPVDRSSMILVAVNLDPFQPHEVTLEVPLWEWSLPDEGTLDVRDLTRDTAFVWQGKLQRIRLDPADLPYAIWHVTPREVG